MLVHGLMCTETSFRAIDAEGKSWDYGTRLAADLGYEPYYLRYNTGLHISENGRAFDLALEELVESLESAGAPIDEVALIGHSMGGLVIRSACHAASEASPPRKWLRLVKRAFYLGSPHLGAPLERIGNVVAWALGNIPNPVTELLAEIANFRSDGVKDLRYANLRKEDWHGLDADALLTNSRHPVPLLPSIRHHLVAGTIFDHHIASLLFGDAMVLVKSATGRATERDRSAIFPEEHVRLFPGLHHMAIAHHPEVYAMLRRWMDEPIP